MRERPARRAPLLLLAACAVALAVLAVVAARDERDLAFSTNARAERVLAVATAEREVCQRNLEAAGDFDTVELLIGTYGRPGPPLRVEVRDGRDEPLAAGTLPAGAPDNRAARVRVEPEVRRGPRVDVCVRTAERRVALYGGPESDLATTATAGPRQVGGDLRMSFRRSEPESVLALVPDMLRRAALFRPEAVGAWAFWVLLVALGVGVPALLAAALRGSAADGEEPR